MNVTNINDKREFNEDGTYNGAYGDMVQVPKSLYTFMIQSSQQVLPSINKHVIAYNMKKQKKMQQIQKLIDTMLIKQHCIKSTISTIQTWINEYDNRYQILN